MRPLTASVTRRSGSTPVVGEVMADARGCVRRGGWRKEKEKQREGEKGDGHVRGKREDGVKMAVKDEIVEITRGIS